MRSNLTIENIRRNWENLSDSVNGKLIFSDYEKANIYAGIITAKIEFNYKGLNVLIHQGIFQGSKGQFGFRPVDIIGIPERKINFNCSIWKTDFLDKLFNPNRLITGFKEFDKKFAIKGEPKRDLIEFFRDENIRNLFLQDRNITFNVSDNNGENQIKLRGLNSAAKLDKVEYLKDTFLRLVNRLVEVKILNPNL